MLKDIRTTQGEEHWEELRRRWTSLLSYRYLGRSHTNLNSDTNHSQTTNTTMVQMKTHNYQVSSQ